MRLIQINGPFLKILNNLTGITNQDILSFNSIIEADLLFINLNQQLNSNITVPENKRTKFEKELIEFKEEFKEYLSLGKDIVVFTNKLLNKKIYVQHENSALELTEKTPFTIESLLSIRNLNVTPKDGFNIQCVDELKNLEKELFKTSENIFNFSYTFALDNTDLPVFRIGKTKHIVGIVRYAHGGRIFFLPGINPNFLDGNRFKSADHNYLVSRINGFLSKIPYKTPNIDLEYEKFDWIENHTYLNILDKENEKTQLCTELNSLKNKIEFLKKEIEEKKELRNTVMQTGEILEANILKIFLALNYKQEETEEKNRVDLILSKGKSQYVIEVKGLNGSSGEKNAAQLEKWVSNFIINKGEKPKGILIVNTYRKKALDERTKVDFPQQMLKYVKSREHCCLTVLTLLELYADFKSNKISETEIDKLFSGTVGVLKYHAVSKNGLRKK